MIGTYSSRIRLTFVSNQIYQDSDYNLRDDIEIGTPIKLIDINFGCIRRPLANSKLKARKPKRAGLELMSRYIDSNTPNETEDSDLDALSFLAVF